jgi:N-acetylglucosaminyldiphosphoundecaprenol N-acetyl-beta-D-mannosaminyltransferase
VEAGTAGRAREAGVECVEIAGLPLARITAAQVVEHVTAALARGEGGWVVTANVDFAQRAASDPAHRALYREADLVLADGLPLVWASRLRGEPLPERVAGADLVWSLAEAAARESRSLYLLGGAGRAAEDAALHLCAAFPALRVAGHASPWVSVPPEASELAPLRRELARVRPDLVYVAFGSPKQEHVIRALRAELPATWWLGCGISLSFVAGDVGRAPRWMQRAGLEWLHRLSQEPARLAGRYLLHNLPFAVRLLFDAGRARVARSRARGGRGAA